MGPRVLWWPLCCSNVSWICITLLWIDTTGWQNRCWWRLKKQIEPNFWKFWKQEKFWRKHLQAVNEFHCSKALRVLVWDTCWEEHLASGLQALGFWKRISCTAEVSSSGQRRNPLLYSAAKVIHSREKNYFWYLFLKCSCWHSANNSATNGEWRLSQK